MTAAHSRTPPASGELVFRLPWRRRQRSNVMRGGFRFERGVCRLDVEEGVALNPYFVGNTRICMRHIGAQEQREPAGDQVAP